MKKFHIVGAFDRHNYGDILFPLIHSAIIKSRGPSPTKITYYATSAADLTIHGGVITQPLKKLIQKKPADDEIVIMAGGDILAADWADMAGHLCSPNTYLLIRLFRKALGFNLSNLIIRSLLLQKNDFPYIISKKNINSKIYYCATSGSGFTPKNHQTHLEKVAAELKQIDDISVRDQSTQRLLSSKGVRARLVPDSALVMSDIFTQEKLSKRPWQNDLRKTQDFNAERYIVFQGAKNFISKDIDYISEQLASISKERGLAILLLPIGRATGHEDHVPLEFIFERLKQKGIPCAIQDSTHVLDIMASIAFCKSYIGTSLHGAISAYSFGHKVCGIRTEKVRKLHDFVTTWMQPSDYQLPKNTSFNDQFLELTKESYQIGSLSNLSSQKDAIYTEIARYW